MSYTWWDKPGKGEPEFILGFGGIAGERIAEGIRRLAEVWAPYMKGEMYEA
ncbi:hypothetical protein D3C75_1326480 [compost metagenome]